MLSHSSSRPGAPVAEFPGTQQSLGFLFLLLMLAILAALQLAGSKPDEAGQRRLSESSITERKKACRGCAVPPAIFRDVDDGEAATVSVSLTASN